MNSSRKTLLAFAAALVLLAARPARAQFSLGGHASYSKAGGADGTWSGGAQLRLRFPGPLGVEGLIDYRRTTYSAGGEDVLRIEQYPVQASLMLFILPGQVQPYVLGGVAGTTQNRRSWERSRLSAPTRNTHSAGTSAADSSSGRRRRCRSTWTSATSSSA